MVKITKEIKGIEGWLYFIALGFAVLTPIFIFFQLVSDPSTDFTIFIFNVVLIGFSIFVGVSIFRKKEGAIIWAKEFLTAYLVISLIDLIFYFAFLDSFYEAGSYNPIRNVLFAIIWLLYFNQSERVRNTFKNTKLNWKRMAIILILVIISSVLLFFSYGFFNGGLDTTNQTPVVTFLTSTLVSGELSPNYVEFREFTDQIATIEVKFEFSSNLPINVYFVPSSEDWDKFMASEQYNSYRGCSFEEKTFGVIDCNVSSGGIIIHNPNFENVTYTIKPIK